MKSALTCKWMKKLVVSLVHMNPQLKKAIELKKTQPWEVSKAFVDHVVVTWMQSMMDLGKVTFHVEGRENIPQGAVIYTPNHQSAFDFPAIILNIPAPCSFISKKEAKKLPVVNKWMRVMDCVFVDRKNKAQAHSTLEEAIKLVKAGRSMVVFPEGTRSKNGQLGEFHGGAMKIAMETGAPVVPVLIEHSRERFEQTGNIMPGEISITFLPAIETKGLVKEDFLKMPAEIRGLIASERQRQQE